MRSKRLVWNTTSSLLYQFTAIICGFVLPRLILKYYGTEVNGIVSSITQFLQFVSFFELGIGAVVQSSLYKPLAEKNEIEVSKIIHSASRFFDKLALLLGGYVVILLIFYPYIVKDEFGVIYTITLILAMCISSFAQYYLGVVDQILLTADQKGYIQYNIQTITLIVSTLGSALMIYVGMSIHAVKLMTSFIYLLRPLFVRLYVKKYYSIDRKIKYDSEPIKQKWNGVAQHIATVVLNNTDTMVLTIFSTLTNVSIYSVYYYVVYGVKILFTSTANGVQSLLGELWAKKDDTVNKIFGWIEWGYHVATTFVFGCTGVLIVPFVLIYTKGVTDADYIQPVFAIVLTIAHASHCLRLPYNIMIKVAGHYKQTQRNYFVSTIMNIIISIVFVHFSGLIGVAIGTLVAMLYQTIWMAIYNAQRLVKRDKIIFFKQLFVDLITSLIATFLSVRFQMSGETYLCWFVLAIEVAAIWGMVVLIVNSIFYYNNVKNILQYVKKKIVK